MTDGDVTMADDRADVVEDRLFAERLRLLQPRRGHRAGTDAVLLAAAVPADFDGHIADLGAGVGTVGLAAAALNPLATVTLVERDVGAAALAQRNIALNALEERVRLAAVDLFAAAARQAAGLRETADLVLTNPPFHDENAVRRSPDAARRSAHVLEGGTLDDWLRACTDVTRPGGWIVAIHRADALQGLLAALEGRFGGLTVRPVHPRADAPATRLLIAGVKGSRAPLCILPQLTLHTAQGAFTAQMQAVNRGEARVAVRA
ncbi:tRNA1(Val) (adenine(37)-N6)-methyltransferase [Pseudochelatococcus lubricantis]|uniref:tRNA1(Val) (adenine(37)-N6)-methyltransferase n=1 Tax=Pseudochelatococcus lubricantis TaxID=1538102 RepID=UPI0035EC284E